MSLLIDIFEDFIFFSFLESFIFCLYFRKFGNCEKFSLKDIFIIGLINCVVSQTIPPLIYQTIMIIWMGLYLKLFKNKTLLNGLWLSFSVMIVLLMVESFSAMIYDSILNINMVNKSKFIIFMLIIPIKIFEVILAIGGEKMKAWWSEIEKRK